MPPTLTDEQLICCYLPQQPTLCFDVLYRRYAEKVHRQCLTITQDTNKAQDFTHDIFIKVFDKLAHFEQRSRFSTWLYSITYHYCIDQMRRDRRLTTTLLDERVGGHWDDSGEWMLREETMQLLGQALESLSVREQTLLKLKYEQGVSIRELAGMYDLNIGVIKMRLRRSRTKIEQYCARQQEP
ncbi:RNA polymerase sigma factor [Spirosoma koreense]